MKRIFLIGLTLISSICFSQSKVDLHLQSYPKPKVNFYDFKYKMKDQYYFKGDIANWSNLKLKGQFILHTSWGIIYIGIILPPIFERGIIK